MVIAVLAVQGAFIEHEQALAKLGAEYFEIRKKEDLDRAFDGLILPGGESTVQGKLLRELHLFDTLKEKIESGTPVLATCAGMILLAQALAGDDTIHFGTLPMTVKRNAYGRQLGSFLTKGTFNKIPNVPMRFIRAPYVEYVEPETKVLASVGEHIVAVQYKNQIAVAFHPELDIERSTTVYDYFLTFCKTFSGQCVF